MAVGDRFRRKIAHFAALTGPMVSGGRATVGESPRSTPTTPSVNRYTCMSRIVVIEINHKMKFMILSRVFLIDTKKDRQTNRQTHRV